MQPKHVALIVAFCLWGPSLAAGTGGGLDLEALRKTSAFSRERFRALAAPGR